jgi:hypothetical protein
MHIDSLKHHISHLEASHSKLERDLILLEQQHGNDTVKAHDLKKKKLFFKDEIERCRQKLTEML